MRDGRMRTRKRSAKSKFPHGIAAKIARRAPHPITHGKQCEKRPDPKLPAESPQRAKMLALRDRKRPLYVSSRRLVWLLDAPQPASLAKLICLTFLQLVIVARRCYTCISHVSLPPAFGIVLCCVSCSVLVFLHSGHACCRAGATHDSRKAGPLKFAKGPSEIRRAADGAHHDL